MNSNRRGFLQGITWGVFGLVSTPAFAEKSAERLEFRLAKAKTLHLDNEQMAKSYEKSFRVLGVACRLHGHDDHFDLTVECPRWKRAEFASQAEVEKWRKWLQAVGFDTKHAD